MIYFGVSEESENGPSAHLMVLDPATDAVTELGDVLSQLKKLGIRCRGQNKIHTKILQAADGMLYFASLDESGENEDGSKLPVEGSHLWRLQPGSHEWEHLGHQQDAILACAVSGKFVYYLGYFGHVLYQYDTRQNRITNSVRVGSVGGHTTRNFLANEQGHVFVPRVRAGKAELVEFDEDLHEVKSFPLKGYSLSPDSLSHGIVGLAALKEGAWLFTTDRGRLYRLDSRSSGAVLTDFGWLHPRGECYPACLFSSDGETQVVALANTVSRGEPKYDWIAYDLRLEQGKAAPVSMSCDGSGVLAYGSFTRDDAGRFYIGGRYLNPEGKQVPAIWCVEP